VIPTAFYEKVKPFLFPFVRLAARASWIIRQISMMREDAYFFHYYYTGTW
jgi:hypothetical protein